MIVEQFEVLNELGFHARVASSIVRELRKFESNVILKKEGKDFNLKSVLGVMTVNAKKGDVVIIEFSGSDEAAAVEAVRVLFLNKFGEK